MGNIKSGIPKILWAFWSGDQKLLTDCIIIKTAMESWKRHLDGWEIRLVTPNNVQQWIDWNSFYNKIDPELLPSPGYPHPLKSVNHMSDLVRLMLISKYGGIYADVDVLCTSSISALLKSKDIDFYIPTGKCINKNGCFLSEAKTIKWNFDKNSMTSDEYWPKGSFEAWLICARKNHPLINRWLEKCIGYYHGETDRYSCEDPNDPLAYFFTYESLALALNDNPHLNKYISACCELEMWVDKGKTLRYRSGKPGTMTQGPHRWGFDPNSITSPYYKLKRSDGNDKHLKIQPGSVLDILVNQ